MNRPSLAELEERCQKPDHRRVGNWMARRVARPAALRITWLVAPMGLSADMATLAAWGCGLLAAAALAWGTPGGWLIAAGLLQLWYLLDHVDGQLARLRGTASLDGVQLDYMMHHTLNLLVPLGAGWGVFAARAEPLWFAAGLVWGVASLVLTMQHDTRCKAHFQRLKRLRGRLEAVGGGGARPEAQPPMPRNALRLAAWAARKACEAHVVLNSLAAVALLEILVGHGRMTLAGWYLAAMAPISLAVAGRDLLDSQRRQTTETEFAAWFQLPAGRELTFLSGWWFVEDTQSRQAEMSPSLPPADVRIDP